MRILAASAPLGFGLLALTASCAWPPTPPAEPPAPAVAAVALTAPVTAVAAVPPPPATPVSAPTVLLTQPPPAPVAVAAAPPPREVEFVPVPFLWLRMLTKPAPAGRLMLNNFSFEPALVQAALAVGPGCAIGDPGTATEFVLPPNGTRVIPAPSGVDICWRRELTAGEATATPPAEPWTAWSRAYTGPGRFLDAVVLTPSPPVAVAAAVEKAPAPPPPAASRLPPK